jgi:hypothetical protein
MIYHNPKKSKAENEREAVKMYPKLYTSDRYKRNIIISMGYWHDNLECDLKVRMIKGKVEIVTADFKESSLMDNPNEW